MAFLSALLMLENTRNSLGEGINFNEINGLLVLHLKTIVRQIKTVSTAVVTFEIIFQPCDKGAQLTTPDNEN